MRKSQLPYMYLSEQEKEQQRRWAREYRERNLGNCQMITEDWIKANKERYDEYQRRYRETHKEEIRERNRRYYQAHKAELALKHKQYQQEHKEEIKQRRAAKSAEV